MFGECMGEGGQSEQNWQGYSFSIRIDRLGWYYMTHIIEGGLEKNHNVCLFCISYLCVSATFTSSSHLLPPLHWLIKKCYYSTRDTLVHC